MKFRSKNLYLTYDRASDDVMTALLFPNDESALRSFKIQFNQMKARKEFAMLTIFNDVDLYRYDDIKRDFVLVKSLKEFVPAFEWDYVGVVDVNEKQIK